MPLNPIRQPTKQEQIAARARTIVQRNEAQIDVILLGIALTVLALVVVGPSLAVTTATLFSVGVIAEMLAKRGR